MTRAETKHLAWLVGGIGLAAFLLAYRKYTVFGADSGDLAYFDNMFWCTVNGRGVFHSTGIGYTNLAVHAAFLWALLIPVYWLIPGLPTLLFMQALFLSAAIVPMYLIARHVLKDHRASLIAAAAFGVLPPIASQYFNQVEEPSFIAVFLLFAFYFFQQEKFSWFMLFAGIACLGRENIPLAIIMFGVYAFWLRRPLKWVVAPAVMGGVYFWFAMFVLMPYVRRGHEWHVMRMFSYLGDTPGTIVMNALNKPGIVFNHLLGQENVMYALMLFQPLGWVLPLFSPASLLALPDLALNLITDNGAMKVIPWHYNIVTGCFLFVGVICTVGRFGERLRQRFGGNPHLVMAGILLAMSLAHWPTWFSPRQFQQLPHHDVLIRAIDTVPTGKSVLASIRLLSHLGLREHFNNLSLFNSKPDCAEQFEYVILDANERQYPPFVTQEFFNHFYRNPKYHLEFAESNVFVFRRLGGESDWKIPVQ